MALWPPGTAEVAHLTGVQYRGGEGVNDYRILHGDALTQLRTIPDASVHCAVTSPPYYGLRDYCVDGQIGLEPTVDAYVARLVEVCEEVRRVLRDDGTFWLNLGDSYNSNASNQNGTSGDMVRPGRDGAFVAQGRRNKIDSSLKPKDLIGVPWRVAFALQAAGWWLRADIIWAKRAPMPESVTDRPTRSHEDIFLLTKRERYYYDAEAVKEPSTEEYAINGKVRPSADVRQGFEIRGNLHLQSGGRPTRNQRDVWHLSPEPYPAAHFATFPTEIPRRAILAGTSERGCCPACGAPWERTVERTASGKQNGDVTGKAGALRNDTAAWAGRIGEAQSTTTGWRQTCACPPAAPIPCTVLDPFLGSGTTVAVAVGLGRHAIGIELNQDYISLAEKRIRETQRPLL